MYLRSCTKETSEPGFASVLVGPSVWALAMGLSGCRSPFLAGLLYSILSLKIINIFLKMTINTKPMMNKI